MNARDGLVLAVDEVATATAFAMPAMAAHKTHAHPLSFFPSLHTTPEPFGFSNHFMAGNARVSESWKTTFHRKSIVVANATRLDPDSDLPKGRLDDRFLDEFQRSRFRCLHCFVGPTHMITLVLFFCSFSPPETTRSRVPEFTSRPALY